MTVGPLAVNSELFPKQIVLVFPLVLTIGGLLIPLVPDYADHALAAEASQQRFRWFLGHALCGIAFGFSVLGAGAIAQRLLQRSSSALVRVGMALIAMGAALHIVGLGADGVGPLAVSLAGGQVRDFFDGSSTLTPGIFIAASATFGLGQILQIITAIRTRSLLGSSRMLVAGAGLFFILFEAVPSGWGLYGVFVTTWIIYVSLMKALWSAK